MTSNGRRAIIWGGMFVLALAGGSLLGSFAVRNLGSHDPRSQGSSDVANFWEAQDRAHNAAGGAPAQAVQAAAQTPNYGQTGNHICDGCDADQTRSRLRTQSMGFHYAPGGNSSAPAEDAATAP